MSSGKVSRINEAWTYFPSQVEDIEHDETFIETSAHHDYLDHDIYDEDTSINDDFIDEEEVW